MTTTSLTLLNWLEGIFFQSLPKNFQDAVIITKSIGIRYLWIDSLCIIQDNPKDWELESANMGKVYLPSTCTIAASASGSSTERFKKRPTPISEVCFVTRLDNWKVIPANWKLQNEREWIREVDGSIMIKIFKPGCIPPIWDERFSRQPLNQRGWVLQERQLSRRVLHYTKSKLLWECRSLRACDDIPWGLSHGSATRKPRVLDGREGSWKGDIFNAWHTMTQDYSSMLLTRDTDKLGALSGLAKEVQRSLASNYIAGIWEDNFSRSLLWQVVPGKVHKRPSQYRDPTWSWISLDGPIKYPAASQYLREGTLDIADDETCAKLIHSSVIPVAKDPMVQLLSASLVWVSWNGSLLRRV
jgi:hypothetical protein